MIRQLIRMKRTAIRNAIAVDHRPNGRRRTDHHVHCTLQPPTYYTLQPPSLPSPLPISHYNMKKEKKKIQFALYFVS